MFRRGFLTVRSSSLLYTSCDGHLAECDCKVTPRKVFAAAFAGRTMADFHNGSSTTLSIPSPSHPSCDYCVLVESSLEGHGEQLKCSAPWVAYVRVANTFPLVLLHVRYLACFDFILAIHFSPLHGSSLGLRRGRTSLFATDRVRFEEVRVVFELLFKLRVGSAHAFTIQQQHEDLELTMSRPPTSSPSI